MAERVNPPARERIQRKAGDYIMVSKRPTPQDEDEVLASVQRGDMSQAVPDPFALNTLYGIATGIGGDVKIIAPPVNLAALIRMPNDNSILRQCIEAMVINIEGHGHRLEYVGPDGQEQSAEAIAEKDHIEDFLPSLHSELSLTELRKRIRWDIETLGFSYIELGRSKDGLPIFLSHIPAHTMRVTTVDLDDVQVKTEAKRFGKTVEGTVRRRFRRFVQLVGTRKIWFKEHGDPRVVDPSDGKVSPALPYEDTATEIIFTKQYYPGQTYGLPRWFNNLVAIQGSRQAELTNLDYFKENAIPAMAVLVSGGALATPTIQQIEDHVTAARGRQASNRVLIVEVQGDENAASREGTIPAPKIELKPLAGDRIKEGQFLEYDRAQIEKVRSSFRLPPIFTGHAQDYSRASAMTSYEVAESQVFGPERAFLDDIINRHVLQPYGVKYWEVRSNPPRISDPQEIMDALIAFDTVGAMTPNVAIGLANEQFGLNIDTIEEDWGNFPWALVQALAVQGKIEGFEDILKELPETPPVAVDANGQPVQPVAADGTTPAAEEDDANKSKAIRAALGNLRTVLETNQTARYRARNVKRTRAVNPRARTRKAA